jgi:tetratricopeptide (TPR) repeat protein
MADLTTGSRRRLLVAFAESSRDLAAPLARALEAAGFDIVFQASEHQTSEQASAAIDDMHAVIVCWTPAAVASDRVNLQAGRARKARKLVPVMLAPCRPPSDVGSRIGVIDLTGWAGDPGDPAFLPLTQALHARFSGRVIGGRLLTHRNVSLGGAGAASLAAIAVIANAGGLKGAYDSFANPAASERALSATEAKVDAVLTLLKTSSGDLSPGAETALRESIARLLSAQKGARGKAADKLARGDLDGALKDLRVAAGEGERAAASLAETWKEIGALAFADQTWDAIDAYKRATELAPDDVIARSQLGNLYMRTSDLFSAEEQFQRVYETADADELDYQAFAAGSLGQVALRRDDLELAKSYLEEALELDSRAGNVDGQAADYGDIGEIHLRNGELKSAETMFRKSLDLYTSTNHGPGRSGALERLGRLELERKNAAGAEAWFRQSLKLSEDNVDKEGQALALDGLARVALLRNRPDEAATFSQQSLDLSMAIGSGEMQAITLTRLGELAERRRDKVAAINHYRAARDIYRTMGLEEDAADLDVRLKENGAKPHPEGPEN